MIVKEVRQNPTPYFMNNPNCSNVENYILKVISSIDPVITTTANSLHVDEYDLLNAFVWHYNNSLVEKHRNEYVMLQKELVPEFIRFMKHRVSKNYENDNEAEKSAINTFLKATKKKSSTFDRLLNFLRLTK